MNRVQACRMCLTVDARMLIIADTPLQAVYENITNSLLQSADGKPVMACYLCHHMLQKSGTFIEKSLRADKLLQGILDSGVEITQSFLSNIQADTLKPSLTISNEGVFDLSPEPLADVKDELVEIKIERDDVTVNEEAMDFSEEYYQTEVKKEPGHELESKCVLPHAIRERERGFIRGEPRTYEERGLRNEQVDNKQDTDSKTHMWMSNTTSDSDNEDHKPNIIAVYRGNDLEYAKNTAVKCELCGVVLKSSELKDHIKLAHFKVAIITTREENDTDDARNDLLVDRSEKQWTCSYCSKNFPYKNNLDIHLRTHTGEKPYSCSLCDKAFNQKQHLKSHIKTHTGEKPFSCEQCGKAFNRKGDLKAHIKRHTGVKPFHCKQCDKSFTQRPHLIDHIRTHTGERPYICHVCDKAFSKNSTLTVHMKTHSAEKPYRCNQCDKAFSQGAHLKDHMRTHTGEKPFTCSVCDKAFSKKNTLKVHIKTHSAERPYHCSQCDKWFGHKAVLKRHTRRMHT